MYKNDAQLGSNMADSYFWKYRRILKHSDLSYNLMA